MIEILLALAVLAQDPPPQDPVKELEKELDRIVAACAALEEKFTLGAAGECLQQARIFASVAERAGDPKAQAAVGSLAIDRISKAVTALETRSSDLRRVQNQLEKGRKRAAAAADDAKRLVAIQYSIDRASLIVAASTNEAAELVNLGIECLKVGSLEEAEDALAEAESRISTLRASSWEATPEAPRMAPVLLSRVRASQGKIKEAAEDLRRGIDRLPSWLDRDMSFKEVLHAKPEDCDKLVKSLEARGDDADALLLLGHERYFSEGRSKSKELFERVIKKRPDDKTAKTFLEKLGG